MGLSNTKEEQLRKQPIMESFVRRSADGKYIVHKTVITHIKPVAYYEAVLENEEVVVVEEA
jgi:hypothetical protein